MWYWASCRKSWSSLLFFFSPVWKLSLFYTSIPQQRCNEFSFLMLICMSSHRRSSGLPVGANCLVWQHKSSWKVCARVRACVCGFRVPVHTRASYLSCAFCMVTDSTILTASLTFTQMAQQTQITEVPRNPPFFLGSILFLFFCFFYFLVT